MPVLLTEYTKTVVAEFSAVWMPLLAIKPTAPEH